MGELYEMPAVRHLRVGIDVGEVLYRHGLDAGVLQLGGDVERVARSGPRLEVVTGDGAQPGHLVVGPARDSDPPVVAGARVDPVQWRGRTPVTPTRTDHTLPFLGEP